MTTYKAIEFTTFKTYGADKNDIIYKNELYLAQAEIVANFLKAV